MQEKDRRKSRVEMAEESRGKYLRRRRRVRRGMRSVEEK